MLKSRSTRQDYNLKIEQTPAPHPDKSFKFRMARRRRPSPA